MPSDRLVGILGLLAGGNSSSDVVGNPERTATRLLP